LNLHNGTNLVYAIWSTTNLLAGWQVETEVWPTNGTVTPTTTPFTVATLARQNLFLQAEDWTGVTENGNTTPEWWFWANFGTVALSDTNLDSSGLHSKSGQPAFQRDYSRWQLFSPQRNAECRGGSGEQHKLQ
jgi:hypothetical protein